MRRVIVLLMLGIFSAFLFTAAISVYVFHDVDKDQIGHWNDAFAGLCAEGVLFTVIVGGGAALLALIGQYFFHLRGYPPRPKLALFLGFGVTVLQYPWDFVGRTVFPKLADAFLSSYLIFAIVICSVVILRDCFMRRKLRQASTD